MSSIYTTLWENERLCRLYTLSYNFWYKRPLLNCTPKFDLFGETLFFYPVANTFSQTGCQIPTDSWPLPYQLNLPLFLEQLETS